MDYFWLIDTEYKKDDIINETIQRFNDLASATAAGESVSAHLTNSEKKNRNIEITHGPAIADDPYYPDFESLSLKCVKTFL